ncbi:two-component system, NarL family, sensor histidine kinase DesK [Arthrobacter alpinus]|uniref:Two-component system, NarL family, sensor histidine kinase DesK n=1 Tax=Arthrobacter alpinus TaxID=656366 RepID=A0A1H5ML28_9MICC|nr:histidine kinase [Arthrobacter alpinus]SEE89933.1 two-component system, NarL family, sensor histidine kinase DesK [Arthrobacter alpinus]
MPIATPSEILPPSARPGRSVRATWTYTLGSIVFVLVVLDAMLVSLALEPITNEFDGGAGLLLVSLLLSVAIQIRYCWFLRAGLGGGLPSMAWTLALVSSAAAVWVLGLFGPAHALMWSLPLWLAVCVIACLLPKRQRWLVLMGAIAVSLLHPAAYWLLHGRAYGYPEQPGLRMLFVYAAGMPLVLISSLWWWRVVVELDRHRLMAGELAVTQERLRFAADLHDIQGHHLQVIALKSELAERLMSINPEAARANIHETRLIAKQALEETRSLVSGYRETVLENELENAREVLSAAGASCDLQLAPVPAHPATQKALAMTVREATTNILRHSEATAASITLAASAAGVSLAISNNGAPPAPAATGTGLLGLRERLEALGGTLETSMDAGRFELQAWIPSKGTLT